MKVVHKVIYLKKSHRVALKALTDIIDETR